MDIHLVARPADRAALRDAINDIVGCWVAAASAPEEGARDLVALRPETVVVTLYDGDPHGTQVLRALRTVVPRPISVALLERDTPQARAAARRAGADYCFDRARGLSPFKETLEILAMAKGGVPPALPVAHSFREAARPA